MAIRRTITEKTLRALKPAAAGKRYVLWDGIVPSFGVRVTDRRHVTFIVMRRVAGKLLRHSIGDYPAIGLGTARTRARAALEDMTRGVDPKAARTLHKIEEAQRRKNSFAAVAHEFIARHVRGGAGGTPLRSAGDIEGAIRREFIPRWGERPIDEVRRIEVIRMLEETIDRGKRSAAHHLLSYLKTLYNWAIGRGKFGLEHSPCDRIKPGKLIGRQRPRQRVLSDDEIRQLWQASAALGYPFGPFVRLLLLTGQRLSEVAAMSWTEIDAARQAWVIPPDRMKGAAAHLVPLSAEAREILDALPQGARGEFIFSTTEGAKPVKGFSKAKDRLDVEILRLGCGSERPIDGRTLQPSARRRAKSKRIRIVASGHAPFDAKSPKRVVAIGYAVSAWGFARVTKFFSSREVEARILVPFTSLAPSALWLAGPAPFTFHDLRRTMRTGLSAFRDVEDLVRELVIGHARPELHKVYDQWLYLEEKRHALARWGEHVRRIVEMQPGGAPSLSKNVVPLTRRGR
ncbi:MAG: tyrosine-type recombinase/integrase [Alphaproteobacteria bacterium]